MINTNINKTVLAALASLCAWSTWATVPDSWEGDVVLPANTTTETITLSSDVKPTTLTVKGCYVIEGTGVINPGATAGNVTIESGASLTLNNGTYVPTAGYVVNGELILKKNYSIGRDFYTFKGTGTLVLDGIYYKNYNSSGYYGASITSFEGTLILKNGSTVQTSGNTKTAAQLGKGKVVFAGGTATLGNNSYTSNSSYEIVAGTTNTDEMTLPLDKTTIVKGDTDLVAGQQYLVMTASSVSGTGPAVSTELANAGWAAAVASLANGRKGIYLTQQQNLVWNGTATTDWTAANTWKKGDDDATFITYDNVTLSEAGTNNALTVSTTVVPNKVTVNGDTTINGAGQINSCVPIALGTGAALRLDPGAGNAITIDSTIVAPTNAAYEIKSGIVTFTQSPNANYKVDAGATMIMKADYASTKDDSKSHFDVAGTLVLDGMSFNMKHGSTYSADLQKITGTLVVTNNASISLATNNNMWNCLGTGPFVFAGGSVAQNNNTTYSISNSKITIVAGTTNKVTTTVASTAEHLITIPLKNATVVGDPATLTGSEITVLTAPKFSDSDKVTLSEELKKQWKLRVDVGESSSSLKLVRKSNFMIIVR